MRVGLVIYGTIDGKSGGYRYDRELVTRLRARGASVEIFSQEWRSYARRLAAGVDRRFLGQVRSANLDLLLEDELNHPSLVWMSRRSELPPRVSIVHHLRVSERHPRAARAIYRAVEGYYLDQVDGFLCNSRTTASTVRALSPRPRPLQVAEPSGKKSGGIEAEVRRRDASEPIRLLFVGNLEPRKGLHTLLAALRLLPRNTYRLEIAGDESVDLRYAHACHAQASDLTSTSVRFLGYLEGEELEAAYRRADILCVPSQYEGYGIVYAEAMARGLPVIASRGGAADEIVSHGNDGYLVHVEAPGEVADAISQLAEPNRIEEASALAIQRAQELPTWEESMDVAVDFLERLVTKQGGVRV